MDNQRVLRLSMTDRLRCEDEYSMNQLSTLIAKARAGLAGTICGEGGRVWMLTHPTRPLLSLRYRDFFCIGLTGP